MFLGSDDPEDIIRLIEKHPDFKAMYQQIYDICRNVEDMMGLFSEELAILDENTVKYMMDEMQEEIDKQKAELEQGRAELAQINAELNQINAELSQRDAELSRRDTELSQKDAELSQKDAELSQKDAELNEKNAVIAQMTSAWEKQQEELQALLLRVAHLEAEKASNR